MKFFNKKIICLVFVLAVIMGAALSAFRPAQKQTALAAAGDVLVWATDPYNKALGDVYFNNSLGTLEQRYHVYSEGIRLYVTGKLRIAGYTQNNGFYNAVKFDIVNSSLLADGKSFSLKSSIWPIDFCRYNYDLTRLSLVSGNSVGFLNGETYKFDVSVVYLETDSYGEPYQAVANFPSSYEFVCQFGLIPLPPDPVKEGHTFKGWYLDEACTVPYDGRLITEDLPLYAGWIINTYTLTLDANGGQSSAASVQSLYDTVASLPVPTRYGYTFKGWKKSDGNIYNNDLVKGNMTLIAEWEPIILKVTFYVDGAVYKTMDVRYGDLFSTVQAAAQLVTYDIKTVSFAGGIQAASSDELVMVSDAVIVLEEKQGLAQLGAVVLQYLPFILIGAGVAIVLSVLPYRKLKRKR